MISYMRSLGSLLYKVTQHSWPAVFGNNFTVYLELGALGFHRGEAQVVGAKKLLKRYVGGSCVCLLLKAMAATQAQIWEFFTLPHIIHVDSTGLHWTLARPDWLVQCPVHSRGF